VNEPFWQILTDSFAAATRIHFPKIASHQKMLHDFIHTRPKFFRAADKGVGKASIHWMMSQRLIIGLKCRAGQASAWVFLGRQAAKTLRGYLA